MNADMILKSNNIFTGDKKDTICGGIAVKANKIIAVGANVDEYANADTRIIDCGDRLIMPSFIDAHMHYVMAATTTSEYVCMDITKSASEKECIEILKEYREKHPDLKRLRGMGWFPANWNDAPLPTKTELDKAFPDVPVYLLAADAHTMWVNSKGLEEAGITKDFVPASGAIGKFENGELNGLLFEPTAYAPAQEKFMEFDNDTKKKIFKEFNQKLNRWGITASSDMTSNEYNEANKENYRLIKEMENHGELNCRIHIYTELEGHTDFSEALKLKEEFNTDTFQIAGVKSFIDGVTSTFTGLLLEPYSDKPDTCGDNAPITPFEDNKKYIEAANKAGLPVRLHCIGDGAVRMALDLFENSLKENGQHGLINTIEHIETIDKDDIPRFAKLGVIPSMQPYHLTLDANEKIRRVGLERCRWEWPHKTILENGGQLAFGTDCPVIDFHPFKNIYAAVTRCDDNKQPTGVNPEESISLADTLTAYTQGAARAYSRNDIGVLKEGNLADIIVLDCNLFDMDPFDIPNADIDMTIMNGKIVYQAPHK